MRLVLLAHYLHWWWLSSLSVPPVPFVDQSLRAKQVLQLQQQAPNPAFVSLSTSTTAVDNGITTWLGAASSPPSQADIQLLRQAFAEFYGVNRDLTKSKDLLTQTIEQWRNQPPDEQAGLYRVRGDCYMALGDASKAFDDYNQAVRLLQGPGGDKADPAEVPAALLGRARASRSLLRLHTTGTSNTASQAAADYEEALKLSSREEWDADEELLEDGAARNPYAAWEWGSTLRLTNQWDKAATAHSLAASAFDEIGDRARSVISLLDAGIDLAAADKTEQAKSVLSKAVGKTKGVEGRDVALLQRVIAKEGEGRVVLASALWDQGREERGKAESILGEACIRLEELQVDAAERASSGSSSGDDNSNSKPSSPSLRFSIDDDVAALDVSCFKFRDPSFVKDELGWPDNLQRKVEKLQLLR